MGKCFSTLACVSGSSTRAHLRGAVVPYSDTCIPPLLRRRACDNGQYPLGEDFSIATHHATNEAHSYPNKLLLLVDSCEPPSRSYQFHKKGKVLGVIVCKVAQSVVRPALSTLRTSDGVWFPRFVCIQARFRYKTRLLLRGCLLVHPYAHPPAEVHELRKHNQSSCIAIRRLLRVTRSSSAQTEGLPPPLCIEECERLLTKDSS